MIKNKIQLFLGIIFSPILILFVLPLLNCLCPIFKQELSCVQSMASFAFYGLPVAIIAILLSSPLVYFSIKKKWVGILHFGVGGVLVSLIISVLMIFFGEGTNVEGVLLIMLLMGVSSALLFWFIAIKNNISNRSPDETQ